MGTAAGVSRFDGRTWNHYSAQEGLPAFLVTHVHVDGEGVVWAASGEGYPTFAAPWLARFQKGVWEEVKLPIQRARVRRIIDVARGGIYVSTRVGIFHIRNGQTQQFTIEEGLSVNSVMAMVERPDGTVLAAHSDRRRGQGPVEVGRGTISELGPAADAWQVDPIGDGVKGMAIAAVAQDPDGGCGLGREGPGFGFTQTGRGDRSLQMMGSPPTRSRC